MNTNHPGLHHFHPQPVASLALSSFVVPVRLIIGWITSGPSSGSTRIVAQHVQQRILLEEKRSLIEVRERSILNKLTKSVPLRLVTFTISILIGLLAFLLVLIAASIITFLLKSFFVAIGIPTMGMLVLFFKGLNYFVAFLDILLFAIFAYRTTMICVVKGKY